MERRRRTAGFERLHEPPDLMETVELLQRGTAAARQRRARTKQRLHQKRSAQRADHKPQCCEQSAEQARERGRVDLAGRDVVSCCKVDLSTLLLKSISPNRLNPVFL